MTHKQANNRTVQQHLRTDNSSVLVTDWLCSRRPHRVPLLSATNRKWARDHQHWTTEERKNIAWSDESHFLLSYADGRVRIGRKQHESMTTSCLVSTVQTGGRVRIGRKQHESMTTSCLVSTVQAGGDGVVMVWGMFSWRTLDPFIPIEQRLKATPCRIHAPKNSGCSGGKVVSDPVHGCT